MHLFYAHLRGSGPIQLKGTLVRLSFLLSVLAVLDPQKWFQEALLVAHPGRFGRILGLPAGTSENSPRAVWGAVFLLHDARIRLRLLESAGGFWARFSPPRAFWAGRWPPRTSCSGFWFPGLSNFQLFTPYSPVTS